MPAVSKSKALAQITRPRLDESEVKRAARDLAPNSSPRKGASLRKKSSMAPEHFR